MSQRVLCIDPGNKTSGWLILSGRHVTTGESEMDNRELLELIPELDYDVAACEWIQSFGMAVGKEVFDTCRWIGRFEQCVWNERMGFHLVTRRQVKLHICQHPRAKDANIRQAIIDMYPADGGGKTPQIGTKGQPGPLYGIKGHMWSALAVGLTFQESQEFCDPRKTPLHCHAKNGSVTPA